MSTVTADVMLAMAGVQISRTLSLFERALSSKVLPGFMLLHPSASDLALRSPRKMKTPTVGRISLRRLDEIIPGL